MQRKRLVLEFEYPYWPLEYLTEYEAAKFHLNRLGYPYIEVWLNELYDSPGWTFERIKDFVGIDPKEAIKEIDKDMIRCRNYPTRQNELANSHPG